MSVTLMSSTMNTAVSAGISNLSEDSAILEDPGFEIVEQNGRQYPAPDITVPAALPQARARARPSSGRRGSTPISSRSHRASTPSSSLSKKKAEEKRILPVRMRGLGGSSGTGSNVTGKDVEDMIYQCFIRTLNASKQPTEDLPICLTMHPYTAISASLDRRAASEPAWWTGPPPTSSRLSLSPIASRQPVVLPSTSPVKKRRTSGLALGDATELVSGRKRVVMPGFRKATEEDDVIPNEKRKTRGATVTGEVEDSTDAHYQSLHLRYERYESRARLAERQKMEHGRYKLNIRIEYLEGLIDEVWEGAVMRMMQRGKRVRQAEEEHQQQQLNGRDEGPSQAGSSNGKRAETKSLEAIQAEQEGKAYMEIMETGAELLKVLTVPGLKRELIREGKELLARYDQILTKPKTVDKLMQAPPPPPPPVLKPEKRKMSRSMSRDSTMTPPPPESEDEVMTTKPPTLARQESTGSEIEDIPEVSKPASKRIRKTPDTSTSSSRPTRISARASQQTPLSVDMNLVHVEPYYPPATESGKPALIEAADKRLIAIQNVEKAREIQARLKSMAKPGAASENTRTERKSRNETMLPLGVPPPGILGWRSDFDLDGGIWLAMLTERGYGNAIDPPEFEPFEASFLPGIPTQLSAEIPDGSISMSNSVPEHSNLDLAENALDGMDMDVVVDVEDRAEAEIDRVM